MRIRFAPIFVGILALVALSVSPAGAAGWWLQYSDTSTRLCLDADYHANTAYWAVTEAACKTPVGSGAADQVYQLVPQSNGNVWILSGVAGNLCVGVASGSPNDGAAIFLTGCPAPGTNWFAQEWQVSNVSENPNGSFNVLFRNATSQKCITGTGSGVQLFQQTCDSANPHQVWRQHLKESGCTRCVAAARRG